MIDYKFEKCGFFPDVSVSNTDNQKPTPEELTGLVLLKDDMEIHVKNITVSICEDQNKTDTYGGTVFQVGNFAETKEYKGLKIGTKVRFNKENMLYPL